MNTPNTLRYRWSAALIRVMLFTLLACFAIPRPAKAAANQFPPGKMTFQGFLTDASNPPVPLGNTSPANTTLIFKIYDNAVGGNVKWAESQIVTIDKGHFSVLLGEGSAVGGGLPNSADLSGVFIGADASDRWIGITVDGSEVTPRIRFFAAPYAQLARAANTLVNPSGQTTLSLANGKLEGTAELTLNPGPLTVTGNATVSGSATFGSATVSGNLAVTGQSALTGNVTVGTSSSPGRLDVTSSTSSSSNPAFRIELAGANLLTYKSGTSSTTIENTGGGSLNLQTQGGNVGIGTSNPENNKLQVFGLVDTDDYANTGQHKMQIRIRNGQGAGSARALEIGLLKNGTGVIQANEPNVGYHNLLLNPVAGWVGIGTPSPQAPLEVYGAANINKNYRYFNYSVGSGGPVTANANYTILASHYIGCGELNVFSDARIKTVVARSNNRQDLETIQKLRVTDYKMVDTVTEGEALKKGFIAQEVEALIPEAVTSTSRIIPDIYSLPSSFRFEKQHKTLVVTLPKRHGLKTGDKVRILADDSQLELSVTEVPSATEFIVGELEKAPKQIFVYGKEVSDFRTLNYDRIFTTGIAAIQELARRVEELKKSEARIAELEQKTSRMAELEQKAARVDTLEREMAQLKKLVAGLAEAQAPKQVAAVRSVLPLAHP